MRKVFTDSIESLVNWDDYEDSGLPHPANTIALSGFSAVEYIKANTFKYLGIGEYTPNIIESAQKMSPNFIGFDWGSCDVCGCDLSDAYSKHAYFIAEITTSRQIKKVVVSTESILEDNMEEFFGAADHTVYHLPVINNEKATQLVIVGLHDLFAQPEDAAKVFSFGMQLWFKDDGRMTAEDDVTINCCYITTAKICDLSDYQYYYDQICESRSGIHTGKTKLFE